MPKSKPATLDSVSDSRTDLFFIRPCDCEPDVLFDRNEYHPEENGAKAQRFNVREDFGDLKELRESIRHNAEANGPKAGVLVPVRGHFNRATGKFMLTDGERRWRAASALADKGFEIFLPCRPEPQRYDADQRVLDMLITQNGKPLTMLEQAGAIQRLIDSGFKPKVIAKRAGCSVTHVENCLTLLSGPKELQTMVQTGEISATLAVDVMRACESDHARVLNVLAEGLSKAEAAGSDHITAKHLPILTGKAKHHAETSEAIHQSTNPSIQSPAATVPLQNAGKLEGAATDDVGNFISGVEVMPLVSGRVKMEVRTVALADCRYCHGIHLSYPGDMRGGGRVNIRPNIHNLVTFATLDEARVAALQQLRGELEMLDAKQFKFKPAAIALLDAKLAELTKDAALQNPVIPSEAEGPRGTTSDATHSIGSPEVDEPDRESELAKVFVAISPKHAVKERYQTFKFIVQFFAGKKSSVELTKFILDI